MILLVQNDLEYDTDLRAMIGAFFPAEKIKNAAPAELLDYSKAMYGEFRFILICCS